MEEYIYIYIYIYKTRLASNEIFSPSNKIHREVGRAKDLSAPLYKGASYNALSVKQFSDSKNIGVLSHPTYWPDLAPCYFFLFSPKIKSTLKGTHFVSTEEAKAKMTELLKHSYRKLSAPLLCTVAASHAAVLKLGRGLL